MGRHAANPMAMSILTERSMAIEAVLGAVAHYYCFPPRLKLFEETRVVLKEEA